MSDAKRAREALVNLTKGSPPDDWESHDCFGDPQGYGDLVKWVDLSNSGDMHSHGHAVGRWAIITEIRAILRNWGET